VDAPAVLVAPASCYLSSFRSRDPASSLPLPPLTFAFLLACSSSLQAHNPRPFRFLERAGTTNLISSVLLRLLSCIYFGHIRRQTNIIELLCLAYYLRICTVTYEYTHLSDLFHLLTRSTPPSTTMSFNITSDGSPTPRKGTMRFSRAGADLKIDTSPEVLGQAVGSYGQNHYPFALYRALGPSLTANMQSGKRPLGASAQGNQQAMMPQQNAFDGYKVSEAPVTHCNTFHTIVRTCVCHEPADQI
jgi:hypothetical protein